MPSMRRILGSLAVALVVLGAGALAFGLARWHNSVLPWWYHPDEKNKAAQLIGDYRIYTHPLLMLESAGLLRRATGSSSDMQQVVVLGREVSAIYAGLATLCLALAGYVLHRWPGLLAVGLTVGLSHTLLIFAHDFKEDVTLVFGLATFVLALTLLWRRPGLLTAGLLGYAAALAISAKYVGVVAPVFALVVLALPGRPGAPWFHRLLRYPMFLWCFSLVVLLVNHRIFANWDRFLNALHSETEHGMTQHSGLAADVPNWFWSASLYRELTWPVLLALGVFVVLRALTFGKKRWLELILTLFVLANFVILLACPISFFHRYQLPMVVLGHFLAGLGIALLWGQAPARPTPDASGAAPPAPPRRLVWWRYLRRGSAVALLLAVTAVQGPRCLNYLDQVKNDSRLRFEAWARGNLPPRTRLLTEYYVGLPTWNSRPGEPRGVRVIQPILFFAADFGPFDSLKAHGITHVAVAGPGYERFFYPGVKSLPDAEDMNQSRRSFYEQLFARGRLIWESVPQPDTRSYINPTLRVYRLP